VPRHPDLVRSTLNCGCDGAVLRVIAGTLFNHVVGALLEKPGHVQAERLRGPEGDHKLELCWLLNRKVGGIVAAQYTINIGSRLTVLVGQIDTVRDQAAVLDEVSEVVNCGQAMPGSKVIMSFR
jgi:hypothetical protein